MKTNRFVLIVIISLFVFELLLAAFMPVFRCFVYLKLPLHPGDPYGIADVIEYFAGIGLVGLGVLLFLASLVFFMLGAKHRRPILIVVAVVSLLTPPLIIKNYTRVHALDICGIK